MITTTHPRLINQTNNVTTHPRLINQTNNVPTLQLTDPKAAADNMIALLQARDPAGLDMLASPEFRSLSASEQDRVIRTALATTMTMDVANNDDAAWAAGLYGAITKHFADPSTGGLALQPRTMEALEGLGAAISSRYSTMDEMFQVVYALSINRDPATDGIAKHVVFIRGDQHSPLEYFQAMREAIALVKEPDNAGTPGSTTGTSTTPWTNPHEGLSFASGGAYESLLNSVASIEQARDAMLNGMMSGGELSQTTLAASKLELDRLNARLDVILGLVRDLGEFWQKGGQIFRG